MAYASGPDSDPDRRRLLAIIAAAVVGVLALGVLLGYALGRDGEGTTAPPATPPASSAAPSPGSSAPTSPSAPTGSGDEGTRIGTSNYTERGQDETGAWDQRLAAYGGAGVVRTYYRDVPTDWAEHSAPYGETPHVVSFKGEPAQVVAGAHDEALRTWFASLPTDRPTWWSYFHEPEQEIEKGLFTAEEYKAAWAHLKGIADEVGNPQAKATLILMCYTLREGSGRDWREYYPGDEIVEVMGWDCYNLGAPKKFTAPEEVFGRAAAASREAGKPFGISEWGSAPVEGDTDCSGRADWVKASVEYQKEAGAVWSLYWDAVTRDGTDFRLTSCAGADQVWRTLAAG